MSPDGSGGAGAAPVPSSCEGIAPADTPSMVQYVQCTQRVEMIAPDGTSCGATDYAISAETCDTQELKIGADGTVIQQLPDAMETTYPFGGNHTCTWRWWPGAAR